MLINLATTNIDFSNTDKALRQIHNNMMQLKDTLEMALNNLDAGSITLDSGDTLQVAVNSESLRGPQGIPGHDGRDGADGEDGFSPTIVVKTDTDTEYVLTITTKYGSFDTPNLKGGTSNGV